MAGIGAITGATSYAPVGPLPAGVKAPTTPQQQALYDSCKQFEAVFVRQIVSGWMKSARGDDAASGAEGIYQDMADEQMTKSLVEGGTFGLAGTMYGQLASTLGAIAPVTGDGSATTPPSGGAIAGGAAA
jgi:Rod binding domain-containing protein